MLRAVDTAEANKFSVVWVQKFDGVVIEDGDDEVGEIRGTEKTGKE